MKWLITGGCGFIGTSLIGQLIKEGGHCIRVIDNLSVGSRDDLSSVCDFKETDIDCLAPVSTDTTVELVVGDILDDTLALKVTEGFRCHRTPCREHRRWPIRGRSAQ